MISFREYVPLILVLLLVVFSAIIVKPFLLAIFMGALLAYAFSPLYRFIQRGIKNKSLAAFLVCTIFVLIIAVPGFFFVEALVKESYSLFVLVKQKLAIGIFTNCQSYWCDVKAIGDIPLVASQIQGIARAVTNWIIAKGSGLLLGLPQLFMNLFVVFFTMFYFLKDGEQLAQRVGDILSMKQHRYAFILQRLREIIHGVVYGGFLIALIQGAFGALGFFLFGVPSPLFWGLVMALLALIPYVGTGLVWVPASLILFVDGINQQSNVLIFKGVALFVYSFIFVATSDNILKPRIMGQKAGVHPAVILLGILGGIFLLGPLGVLVGPIVLSLTTVVIEAYFLHDLE